MSAVTFSLIILFPMSLPRNASALRFSSLFGVLCSLYLSLAVMFVFFTTTNTDLVPSVSENLGLMQAFKLSYNGLVSSVPLVVFGYMYQVNIPMIYVELERREAKQMSIVVASGSAVAVIFYVIVGVFGYATFAQPDKMGELCVDKNILMAPSYAHSIPI